jgi:hypothetical protein
MNSCWAGQSIRLTETLFELVAQACFVEVAPNEDELAGALFSGFPEAIPKNGEPIVDPVKNGASRVPGDLEKAFAAKDLLFFGKFLDEILESFDMEGPFELEAEGINVVMVPLIEFVEKLRVDGQLSIEIEGMHVEQLFQIHL